MVVTMWFHLWNGRTRGRVRPTVLISNVQQRAMASGQPYLKSGVIARLKHALVFGKVPVWAFSLATVLLLLVVRWCRPCEQNNVSGRYIMRSVPALALLSVLAAAIVQVNQGPGLHFGMVRPPPLDFMYTRNNPAAALSTKPILPCTGTGWAITCRQASICA